MPPRKKTSPPPPTAKVVDEKMSTSWRELGRYRLSEFNLHGTLSSGQAHHWRCGDGSTWVGVMGKSLVELRQDVSTGVVQTRTAAALSSPALYSYFNLKPDLSAMCQQWGSGKHVLNALFKGTWSASSKLCGLRLLHQPPEECLLSFICSQNNHLSRIQSMVLKLCSEFGERVKSSPAGQHFAFPSADALVKNATEDKLRAIGFGYRAGYIMSAAEWIATNDVNELHQSTGTSLLDARKRLMEIKGVGRKVADCVLLFSLGHYDVVPVDTHIQQIAQDHLGLEGTLTDARHNDVQKEFLKAFGPYCGWAHCVLFYARLLRNKKGEKKTEKGKMEEEEDAPKAKRVKR